MNRASNPGPYVGRKGVAEYRSVRPFDGATCFSGSQGVRAPNYKIKKINILPQAGVEKKNRVTVGLPRHFHYRLSSHDPPIHPSRLPVVAPCSFRPPRWFFSLPPTRATPRPSGTGVGTSEGEREGRERQGRRMVETVYAGYRVRKWRKGVGGGKHSG